MTITFFCHLDEVHLHLGSGQKITYRMRKTKSYGVVNAFPKFQQCPPLHSNPSDSPASTSSHTSSEHYANSLVEMGHVYRRKFEPIHGKKCHLPPGRSYFSEPYFAENLANSKWRQGRMQRKQPSYEYPSPIAPTTWISYPTPSNHRIAKASRANRSNIEKSCKFDGGDDWKCHNKQPRHCLKMYTTKL